MNLNLEVLKKIHSNADSVCKIAITRDWIDEDYNLKYQDNRFFDKHYTYDSFIKKASHISAEELEESYFSINSFYKRKSTSNIRHLNAFVLDFDFYKIGKYKTHEPIDFYKEFIEGQLTMRPTAVIDSGRGLYVLYCFKDASKHMAKTYRCIYNRFYSKFKDYGMDAKATNITQLIRIPGSFNVKAFKPVEVLELYDTQYTIIYKLTRINQPDVVWHKWVHVAIFV